VKTTHDYRPALFFVMAYAITWFIWFLGVYVGSRSGYESYSGLFSLGGLMGPIGTTLLLVVTSRSAALKEDFKDRLFNLRRVRPVYALIAVVVPFTVIGLSIGLSLWFGQSADQFRFSSGSNLLPLIILALLLAPICEEMGWHGYGVDSLRAKAGMMKATLLFAALWCGWHLPLALVGGTYQRELAMMDNKIFIVNFFVSIIPAAIIANWFYYKNDRSVAASILLHSMLNAASVLINAGQVAKCIATILYSGIAAGLVLGDRRLFSEGPRNFLFARTEPTRMSAMGR
jgi:membrane protease YdiL (CAAX protease family)